MVKCIGINDQAKSELLVSYAIIISFVEFFENIKDPLKDEYLLPIYIGELLRENKLSVKVLEVQDSWFGVTYKEDAPVVKESFKKLIDEGVYSSNLFDNIK